MNDTILETSGKPLLFCHNRAHVSRSPEASQNGLGWLKGSKTLIFSHPFGEWSYSQYFVTLNFTNSRWLTHHFCIILLFSTCCHVMSACLHWNYYDGWPLKSARVFKPLIMPENWPVARQPSSCQSSIHTQTHKHNCDKTVCLNLVRPSQVLHNFFTYKNPKVY